MEQCISDIKSWMAHNFLKLNDSMTEFLVIGSPQQLVKVKMDNIQVGSSKIKPVSTVRNLGAWFKLTLANLVARPFSVAYKKLKKMREFLSVDTIKTLIHPFVTSNIDYCWPKRQIDRLQINAAARVTDCVLRSSHITPVLKSLQSSIKFKIALLMFKVLRGMAPMYLSELLLVKQPSRYNLRSGQQQHLPGYS